MEPSKDDIISLVNDLRAEIRAFYTRHPFAHDFQPVLRKMDKLDLLLAADYERLWQMEREDAAVLKAKEKSDQDAIKMLERQLRQRPVPTAQPIAFSPIREHPLLQGNLLQRRTNTPTATDATGDISVIEPSGRHSSFDVNE